jgi:hypothetical protein
MKAICIKQNSAKEMMILLGSKINGENVNPAGEK